MTIRIQKSFEQREGTGTLYLVATPIGNLEDMTYRAVRVLKEADCIAAEDTRQTRKLLTHFGISTRLVSYHEHNKQASGPELIRMIESGQSIALVSDAGMPAISDPGYDLVRLAVEAEVPVVPVPGANAALSALVVSGLPTERFLFAGFLPREKKKLREQLDRLGRVPATILLYESPHRVAKTLEAIREAWGEASVAMVRELTKRYEEVARGTVGDCIEWLKANEPLGEYCLVVDRNGAVAAQSAGAGGEAEGAGPWWAELPLEAHVERYERETGDRKEAMKRAAADRGVSKRDIYNALLGK
ncbi:16S rRNA (cytidine(1402)-2'-O)-methyltransferase [Paenibacillus flagellatus]|uniref:Ribosomal RNA small subunit methyltransferase I n=1 Tax=Paenibacillus flagellatus TaxID=2211139 RepID=A0A2V5JYI4_9BACL|nr:16S rRNA (cytidine(1402)-2'-O)-methyltransferase [Paenibacillus flagellatus]PYI50203.1 16S rRNA (cytidine(1402)-2'-O)-methyltransferase [Paenibacillus flagellatus]